MPSVTVFLHSQFSFTRSARKPFSCTPKTCTLRVQKSRFFFKPAFKKSVFLHALIYIILILTTFVPCCCCRSCGPLDYLLDHENEPNGLTEATRKSCCAKATEKAVQKVLNESFDPNGKRERGKQVRRSSAF